MTSQAERGERFLALHARPGAFVIANPWDVGTARVLASLGFEALATTSVCRQRGVVRRAERLHAAGAGR